MCPHDPKTKDSEQCTENHWNWRCNKAETLASSISASESKADTMSEAGSMVVEVGEQKDLMDRLRVAWIERRMKSSTLVDDQEASKKSSDDAREETVVALSGEDDYGYNASDEDDHGQSDEGSISSSDPSESEAGTTYDMPPKIGSMAYWAGPNPNRFSGSQMLYAQSSALDTPHNTPEVSDSSFHSSEWCTTDESFDEEQKIDEILERVRSGYSETGVKENLKGDALLKALQIPDIDGWKRRVRFAIENFQSDSESAVAPSSTPDPTIVFPGDPVETGIESNPREPNENQQERDEEEYKVPQEQPPPYVSDIEFHDELLEAPESYHTHSEQLECEPPLLVPEEHLIRELNNHGLLVARSYYEETLQSYCRRENLVSPTPDKGFLPFNPSNTFQKDAAPLFTVFSRYTNPIGGRSIGIVYLDNRVGKVFFCGANEAGRTDFGLDLRSMNTIRNFAALIARALRWQYNNYEHDLNQWQEWEWVREEKRMPREEVEE